MDKYKLDCPSILGGPDLFLAAERDKGEPHIRCQAPMTSWQRQRPATFTTADKLSPRPTTISLAVYEYYEASRTRPHAHSPPQLARKPAATTMQRFSAVGLILAFLTFHSASAAVGVIVNTTSSDALPILTLPYARVQAKTYDVINDVQTPRYDWCCFRLAMLTKCAVLRFQQYSLRSASRGRPALARAGASVCEFYIDRWLLRAKLRADWHRQSRQHRRHLWPRI